MNDCIFCKIARGEIPSKKFYEDEEMIIIADLHPQAEKHYLLIPKRHYADITEMTEEEGAILGKCLKKLGTLANDLGLENGFRLISNKGEDGAQTVMHLHIHVLGGEKLSEQLK